MQVKLKKVLVLLWLLVIGIMGFSQTSDTVTSSLIIALDVRPAFLDWENQIGPISGELSRFADSIQVKPQYVSGELYGMKCWVRTHNDFVRMVIKPGELSSIDFKAILNSLKKKSDDGYEYYSLTSFAKPYALMALKDNQRTNRTFLAIITDGYYNGKDDYYGEFEQYKKNNPYRDSFNATAFLKCIDGFQTNYYCKYIGKKTLTTRSYYDKEYEQTIQFYEYVPLQKYFTLESVLDFPQKIVANRTKTGYDLKLNIPKLDNKDYEVQKVLVNVSLNNTEKSFTKVFDLMQNDTISVLQSGYSINDLEGAEIELKAWVRWCDGVYNNTILHPNGSKFQGSEGLVRKIAIEIEPSAKVFGTDLPDFLYQLSKWTPDQNDAALGWEFIISFIVIIIVTVIAVVIGIYIYRKKVKKSSFYHPNPQEVKI